MPCTDNAPSPYSWQNTCNQMHTSSKEQKANQERRDLLARIACNALQIVEAQGLLKMASKEAQEWWTEHKQFDEKRARELFEESLKSKGAEWIEQRLTK